jgi:hypothetical protein
MKIRHLLLIVLCAMLCFGGSFTCSGSSGSISATSN